MAMLRHYRLPTSDFDTFPPRLLLGMPATSMARNALTLSLALGSFGLGMSCPYDPPAPPSRAAPPSLESRRTPALIHQIRMVSFAIPDLFHRSGTPPGTTSVGSSGLPACSSPP